MIEQRMQTHTPEEPTAMMPDENGYMQREPHIGTFLTPRIVNFDEVKKGIMFDLSLDKYGGVASARIIKAENYGFIRTLFLKPFFALLHAINR